MGMEPKITLPKAPFVIKECNKCHGKFGPDAFVRTKSLLYPDGYLPICADCLENILLDVSYDWDSVDRLCRYADIPFVPAEFIRVQGLNTRNTFATYAEIFLSSEYEGLGWKDYYDEFMRLKEQNLLEDELPSLQDKKRKELQEKWGANYDDEELMYLENLYSGLLTTQNVTGALQLDQAIKLCKISLEIDSRIRAGIDIDKLLASYDKLVRIADFTPKNVKNASDFESTGELIYWLEKRGFKNKFYDGATRDIVDETLKNMQNWNRRLYTNESGIGESITKRIEALKNVKEMESYYDTNEEIDLDKFEIDGYNQLMKEEEFSAEI